MSIVVGSPCEREAIGQRHVSVSAATCGKRRRPTDAEMFLVVDRFRLSGYVEESLEEAGGTDPTVRHLFEVVDA